MLPVLVALVLSQVPASAPPAAGIERHPFDASLSRWAQWKRRTS